MSGDLVRLVGRGALSLMVLVVACKASPTEAPEPQAEAWAADPDGFDPGPPVMDESEQMESAQAPAPPRPRAAHTIFRDEIERATARGPAYLLRQLDPMPFRHEGHFVGWEITRLFPDDPELCADPCDLAVGDVILDVNGRRLQTPQELSDAFAALPDWGELKVQSLRNGKRRRVTYRIVDYAG